MGGINAGLAALNAHPRYKISMIAPLGMLRLLKAGLRRGVLVKDGRALDALDEVDTVVFDKTGTLTEIILAPAGLALGGVFLLHFGLWQTVELNQLALVGGVLSVHGDDRRRGRRRPQRLDAHGRED